MFHSLTIKSKESDNHPIDIGFLAESLLFYSTVNFLGSKDTIRGLFTLCGVDQVKELIKRGRIVFYIREDIIGTSIFHGGLYDIQKWSDKKFDKEKYLYEILKDFSSDDELKSHLTFFLEHALVHEYEDGIIQKINSDLFDSEYLTASVLSLIKHVNPNVKLDKEISARYYQSGEFGPFKMHRLETSVELDKYNLTPTEVLLSIAEARGNIQIAGRLNSEIADKAIYSSVIQNKFNILVNKFEKNQEGIKTFQDVVLSDYRTIGDTILSQTHTFSEFISVLDKADKFRDWLAKVEDDTNIISEYYKAVISDTWIQKLPAKGIRFGIFTGAGIALDVLLTGGLGTAIGVALGAGDTFIVDKLIKGWKPNQFIDDTVKEFVDKKND
jgi:hypothetical protein